MLKRRRSATVPLLVAGLASIAMAGCSTYGVADYGYYGGSYPNYGYRTPYSYGRGSIYVTPRVYDRGHYFGPGRYGARGYPGSHNGFGHLRGRRH